MMSIQIKKEVDSMYMFYDRNEESPVLMTREEAIFMAEEFESFHLDEERLPVNDFSQAVNVLETYNIHRMGDRNV